MTLSPPAPIDLDAPASVPLILRLALPSVIGLSINALHQLVNAVFVGRLGTDAIAAVSVCFPLAILLIAVAEGAGVGFATYGSRMLGAGRPQQAHQAATSLMLLLTLGGFALAGLLWPFLPAILRAIGATPATLPMAAAYTAIMVATAPLLLLQVLCDFIAISEGNARFSMWTLIGSFGLNLVLDPLFIFVFELGVAGAALATAVSQIAALAAYAVYFAKRMGTIRIGLAYLVIERRCLWQIAAVGMPAALSTGFTALAFILIYRSAAGFGDAVIAGFGIALRILAGGTLPVLGFCLGAQALLGFSCGANKPRRFRHAIRLMIVISSAFTVSYAAAVLIFTRELVAWFTPDPAVAAMAVRTCVAFHVFFALYGMQMVTVAGLQAAGRNRQAALLVLAPQGYFLVPLLLVLPHIWGVAGLVASPAVAAGLSAALAWLLFTRELKHPG